ncbi:hypothetical protein WJX84_001124 [Apatococcus fuscideae]|uniref:Uncharacterized protein n=1 Tax=Apatococcus fuscideae TaxID=2026836 RepID=A0AAW1TCC8_9CHLO
MYRGPPRRPGPHRPCSAATAPRLPRITSDWNQYTDPATYWPLMVLAARIWRSRQLKIGPVVGKCRCSFHQRRF